MDLKTAAVIPLAAAPFAPYGVCLEIPDRAPDRGAPNYGHLWMLADLAFSLKPPFAGVMRSVHRGLACASLECHRQETQTFVPLGGQSCVLAVANNGEAGLPDLSTFRAFLLDGTKGFVLHRGTWAAHFYPLGDYADFVVITGRRESSDDVERVDLASQFGVTFKFVLANLS